MRAAATTDRAAHPAAASSERSGRRSILALVGFLLASLVTGGIGSLANARSPEFYGQLDRPGWSPPASVFGPVWTTLYVMIAVAGWLVWRRTGLRGARGAFTLFGVQLALNALWTWLFFAWRQGALATFEIVVLWLAIAATIVAFWRVRPLAGALMLPYLAWVSFATALTISLWQRNPQIL